MKRAAAHLIVGCLGLLFCAGSISAPAQLPPATTGHSVSPYGFQLVPAHPPASINSWGMVFSPTVTMGRFDENGNVVGGNVVLVTCNDFGTAPAERIWVGSFEGVSTFVSREKPRACTTMQIPVGASLEGYGNSPEIFGSSAVDVLGADGYFYIGLVLLERANQPFTEALGVVFPYRLRIGELNIPLLGPDSQFYLDTPFTKGGAAMFYSVPFKAFVQPPISSDGNSVFPLKRVVVPVKFSLTQNDAPVCTLPPATISVTRTAGAVVGPVSEDVYERAADNGSNFRIDETACQYVYNLGASLLGSGTYQVDINVNGMVVGHAAFVLN